MERRPCRLRILSHESLIKIFSVVLLAATLAVGNAAFASSVFEAGKSLRVFHPTHPRNWREAKTEALITTVWYPVSADKGLTEKPFLIGEPNHPLFEAGSSVGCAHCQCSREVSGGNALAWHG